MAERHRKENREHREWRIQHMCKWNIRRQRQTERGLTNVWEIRAQNFPKPMKDLNV